MPRKPARKKYPIKERLRGLVPGVAQGCQDLAYGAYLETLDPENSADIRLMLASATDPRFREFLERMGEFRGRQRSHLQTVAKACGIGLDEFCEWFRTAAAARAIAVAQIASLPINKDMAVDAASRAECCPRCDGLTWVSAPPDLPLETPGYRIWKITVVRETDADGNESEREEPSYIRTCPVCHGTGNRRAPGDEFSREMLLEQAGLVNKKGPGIALIQNFGGAGHASALAKLNAIPLDPERDTRDVN